MGVLFGLAAALFYGTADFVAQQVTRRVGPYRTLLYTQVVGLLGLGTILAAQGWPRVPLSVWGWTILVGELNTLAYLAFYRAMEVGTLALVSPVAASFGAVGALLAWLGGEQISRPAWLGILLAVVGVMLCSAPTYRNGEVRTVRGLGWALLSSGAFGTTIWLLGIRVTPFLGPVASVWLLRLVGFVTLLILARPLRQPLRLPPGLVGRAALLGLLDVAALLSLALGVRTGQIAVVSALGSLFSTVTVLLAFVLLRERLERHQWFGIAVILLGVVLVNV